MATTIRLGIQVPPEDPFWVQMREAIVQQAHRMHLDIIPIEVDVAMLHTPEYEVAALELILAQEPDAIISHSLPTSLLQSILRADVPVIYLTEHRLQHPQFITTVGLYESAQIAMRFLANRLEGCGRALLLGEFNNGRSRLAAACGVLQAFPRIETHYVSCSWDCASAESILAARLRTINAPLDAIFGFSDGLALLARDLGRELGVVHDKTLVVGIDGDPLAIAAIAQGTMTATVELAPMDLGRQAVAMAFQAAQGRPVLRHCRYSPCLVTQDNVAAIAAAKLIALAHLPSHLVGVNRQQEQQQLTQLETNQFINRNVTALLDRTALPGAIADLIQTHYAYTQVCVLRCDHASGALINEPLTPDQPHGRLACDDSGVLGEAARRNEVIFVPDVQHSHRFTPDPDWPATISRVVVPIHVGNNTTGLLDLHTTWSRPHTRQELAGLQSLADQLGTALRNAELYEDELAARLAAERADALKTRLLANVSHELRTPLHVILGYSQTILHQPTLYGEALPQGLVDDVRNIERSGTHLIHLINDLLDLSRAEIGALDIFPEFLNPSMLLKEVFESMAVQRRSSSTVTWQLDLPPHLPLLKADPVRVRQIVINLLSNAQKFTAHGTITLGAAVESSRLHLWVSDTGSGIPDDLQDSIFEPFVSGPQPGHARESMGLGLSIVQQLVALHGGTLHVESRVGLGSTFHVVLPLSQPAEHAGAAPFRPPAMLLLAVPPDDHTLAGLCRRQGLLPYYVTPDVPLEQVFATVDAVALLCDVERAGATEWSLLSHIRQHAHGCMLPLLLYNSRDAAIDRSAWLARVLFKPFGADQLHAIVATISAERDLFSVLIVDDDPDICASYQQTVARALPNAMVRIATGGAAAVALLEHEVPDLLVLDLVMPHVDGFAVLEQLRAHGHARHVSVVVLSGKTLSAEDIQRLGPTPLVYQSKDVLTADELGAQLQRAHGRAAPMAWHTSQLVKYAIAYMQQHHHRPLSRQEIAHALGINQSYLSEIFQYEIGLTPWEYLTRYRISQAKRLLRDSRQSITVVANRVGFNDSSYFGRVFRHVTGCSPQQFREQSPL